jgi:hypothetical protein
MLNKETVFGKHLRSPCQKCIVKMLCNGTYCPELMKFIDTVGLRTFIIQTERFKEKIHSNSYYKEEENELSEK